MRPLRPLSVYHGGRHYRPGLPPPLRSGPARLPGHRPQQGRAAFDDDAPYSPPAPAHTDAPRALDVREDRTPAVWSPSPTFVSAPAGSRRPPRRIPRPRPGVRVAPIDGARRRRIHPVAARRVQVVKSHRVPVAAELSKSTSAARQASLGSSSTSLLPASRTPPRDAASRLGAITHAPRRMARAPASSGPACRRRRPCRPQNRPARFLAMRARPGAPEGRAAPRVRPGAGFRPLTTGSSADPQRRRASVRCLSYETRYARRSRRGPASAFVVTNRSSSGRSWLRSIVVGSFRLSFHRRLKRRCRWSRRTEIEALGACSEEQQDA